MIVELDDGRELRVPDSWSSSEAKAFGRGVMRGEIDAAAIVAAESLRDAERSANPAVLAELKAIKAAVSADRVLVRDSEGNPIASRVNIPRPRR